jgi:hypothetical protein
LVSCHASTCPRRLHPFTTRLPSGPGAWEAAGLAPWACRAADRTVSLLGRSCGVA